MQEACWLERQSGAERGRIAFDEARQLGAFGADVSDLQQPSLAK